MFGNVKCFNGKMIRMRMVHQISTLWGKPYRLYEDKEGNYYYQLDDKNVDVMKVITRYKKDAILDLTQFVERLNDAYRELINLFNA